MKITDIEIHSISIPYVDWIAYPLNHYHGPVAALSTSLIPITALWALVKAARPSHEK